MKFSLQFKLDNITPLVKILQYISDYSVKNPKT